MEFKDAANTVITFGKHQGKTIDQLGETDEGLKYIDWMNGAGVCDDDVKAAVEVYLNDPTIKSELQKAIG